MCKALKRGDLVRMTHQFKSLMSVGQWVDGEDGRHWRPNSRAHIKEFGRKIGVVLGLVDWGNGNIGPEYDVRWKHTKLKYAYAQEDLQIVRRS
jgi:hypothetical protein